MTEINMQTSAKERGQASRHRGENASGSAANQGMQNDFEDRVIHINRCAKVVKGGRRFSFAAIVVVGDKKGSVGVGLGKASEVPEAIKKATKKARKNVITVPLEGSTIAHEVKGIFGASRVILKPAPQGSGVIASSVVRAILECAGVQNIITKSLRRDNPHNVVKATLDGLKKLAIVEQVRKLRGNHLVKTSA